MDISIISVFPEYFDSMQLSLLGKAQAHGIVRIQALDLRDWTHDVHRSVDDTPAGGGAGMVMKPEVWAECLDDVLGTFGVSAVSSSHPEPSDSAAVSASGSASACTSAGPSSPGLPRRASPGLAGPSSPASTGSDSFSSVGAPSTLIFPNPSAPLFTQKDAEELSHKGHLVFGCGRYEGYDARIPMYYQGRGLDVREYSIGDYVLNGGEVAVSVMVEAITRLIPGFMGNSDSIVEESYSGEDGLLEYKQYTKPSQWRGLDVPEVLLSGDHAKVGRYRRDESLERTSSIRPDIIARLDCSILDKADRKKLTDLGWNVSGAHPQR